MLVSYMREDGEELHQDGNYIEHPLLQRGLLWGVARMSECRPELLLAKGAEVDILPYLDAEDAEVRGLAALACGRLHLDAAKGTLQRLIEDSSSFQLYNQGRISRASVGELAGQALAILG